MKPHWKWVVGFLVGVALVSILSSYFTYLSKLIVDEGILAGNRDRLFDIAIVYGALVFFQAGGVFLFIYLTGVLGMRVQYDMRKMLFNHLQKLSLSYYSRTPVGWIMSRVTSDTERIADLVTWGLLDVTYAVINITTALIFMLTINAKLALVVVLPTPPLPDVTTTILVMENSFGIRCFRGVR